MLPATVHTALKHLHRIYSGIHHNNLVTLTNQSYPVSCSNSKLLSNHLGKCYLSFGHYLSIFYYYICKPCRSFQNQNRVFPTYPTIVCVVFIISTRKKCLTIILRKISFTLYQSMLLKTIKTICYNHKFYNNQYG